MIPPEISSRAPVAARIVSHFREISGRDAVWISFAPGRVNVIGEYTDFNGGFVLPFALPQGVWMAAAPRTDGWVSLRTVHKAGGFVKFDVNNPGKDPSQKWSNYVRGVLAGFKAAGILVPGFDGLIDSNLPPGGGLSSSAALEVSTAGLAEALSGAVLDPVQKALLCQKAEHEYAGTPCGIMDQFSVIFGRRGELLLIDCESLVHRPVRRSPDDTSFLIINTMTRHALSDGAYQDRRRDCENAAQVMGVQLLRHATLSHLEACRSSLSPQVYRRGHHVIAENGRTLEAVEAFRNGDAAKAGDLMYASHVSLRDDMEVSCRELDLVVESARNIGTGGGVYGCRLTGGGFGGCCVSLIQRGQELEISRKIRAEYQEATGIEPVIFAAEPSGGAFIAGPEQL